MGRVVVLGSLNLDLQLQLDRHPTPGETVIARALERRFGGKGGNQAIAAARAGAATTMIGRVGDDEPGRAYRRRLQQFGVDASLVAVVPDQPTGTAVILNDTGGENMITVALGANATLAASDLGILDQLAADDVVLMSLELDLEVVAAAARRSHAAGARVIINLAPYAPLPAAVLDLADPVIVNEHEAANLAAAGVQPPSLLVTLGAQGSRWRELAVPAAVTTVVDTTGAGDAFSGTLAARLALGEDPAAAMRCAAEAATITVGHVGAQLPLPSSA